jgi:nicotinate (nicotinamide) nucleotide adenylyltransferase/ribosome silencing factor RsfS/YbeB/iojap
LGGSFNPAHGGHLHLSLLALRHLDLDAVWWLVSPQNPLKPVAGMAPFALRLEQARRVAARYRAIVVSDLESRLKSRYTADTLAALRRRFPRLRFVWLMGSDNLFQLRRWERWTEIFRTVPIAVFDRAAYSLRALAELPARRFAGRRLPPAAARRLADAPPPAWVFFHSPLHPASATRIRAEPGSGPSPTPRRPLLSTIAALTPRRHPPRARSATGPMAPLPAPQALLELVLDTLEDGMAEDVVTLDLAGKTTIADFMVVASGRSARQVLALTERLEAALSRRVRFSIEGKALADWVLIDAGDVIVHLFRPEIRAYYNLEKMWAEALPDGEAVGFPLESPPQLLPHRRGPGR